MNVSVLIGSYGDPSWRTLADRAAASVARLDPPPHQLVTRHEDGGTLASCRNELARWATGDWLCFLDADDELDSGYLAAMEAAWSSLPADVACQHCGLAINAPCHTESSVCLGCGKFGRAKLLAPAVQYVSGSGSRYRPRIPDKAHCGGDIRRGSWLVIGTLVPRYVFQAVGGFRDYALYEDWALFASCWKAGCEIVEVPDAVYVAHMRPGSRNRGRDRADRVAAHNQITADVFPDLGTPA